jgi:hypothetical protein
VNLLKIIIRNEEIKNIDVIKFKDKVRIIGGYDMNKDNLIDILYLDNKNNLYVLVNDDPYYLSVFVARINTVLLRKSLPRIFVIDTDRDGYPDIITADTTSNNLGILFNHGKDYWSEVKKYFSDSSNRDNIYKKQEWNFIPLIDTYEEEIDNAIRDFTVFKIDGKKRINFEIFAVYDKHLYWFVEKEIGIPDTLDWGSHKIEQNYLYCMTKCEIVVEQQELNELNYHMILDIDVNSDSYPEFILYSSEYSSLYWIKKYVAYLTGFGWKSDFWIYVMIFIYTVSSVVGIFEFYKLKKLNDTLYQEKQLKMQDSMKSEKKEVNLYPSFEGENKHS